ncbi:hypothetical protein ACIGXI_34720 [Kitasatospora aureofaciens]|uniref:hypothetical protein n=1 Tax=Kitasatospora aureofaciens TaxID=1894 RepID=UPI0037C66FEA
MTDRRKHGSAPGRPEPETDSLDPAKHVLTLRGYDCGVEGSPIALADLAGDLRRELENDGPTLQRLPGSPWRLVLLTELRGVVIGSLLRELAARLSPGPEFGPGEEGLELACLARELADDILDQTFVGLL